MVPRSDTDGYVPGPEGLAPAALKLREENRSTAFWSEVFAAALVPGLVLWFQAILVRSSADNPGLIAIVAAVVGTPGLFLRLPLLTRPRWFHMLVLALGVAFLVRLVAFPPQAAERGFVVVPRVLTITLAEFLLWCQVVWLWRWRPRDPLPIAFPGLALLTAVAALNRPLPMGENSTFAVLVTVSLLLPTLMLPADSRTLRWRQVSLPMQARLVIALVCVVVFVGTWTSTQIWTRWLPDAQSWFATRVGRTISLQQSLRRYATSGTLSAIRTEHAFNPDATALRVVADESPGYLTGRIFDRYETGMWRVSSDRARQAAGDEREGLRMLEPLAVAPRELRTDREHLRVFELDGGPTAASWKRMVIENDPRRGRVFFTPLGWRYLRGAGRSLGVDDHDIVRFGISVQMPYVVLVDSGGGRRPLEPSQRRQLLELPLGQDAALDELAARICRGARTPQEKMRAVREYFQSNYEYSLQPADGPSNVDPLKYFLLARHPAHCEYFASGTVVLLRHQGIPTRYATGYCVSQRDDDDENGWIARNRDAHAWAEAYDEQQQRWVIVESTPGFADPTLDDTLDDTALAGDDQARALSLAAEGANALVLWWYGLPGYAQALYATLLASLLTLLSYLAARRARTGRARRGGLSLDPRLRAWHRLVRRMDRRLKRRGMTRLPSETLHQFAHRIRAQSGPDDSWLRSSADWYVAYAEARFAETRDAPPPFPHRTARS